MSPITVLVAATSRDIQEELIWEAIAKRPTEMTLVKVALSGIGTALESIPFDRPCALVLVGPPDETARWSEHWLAQRTNLVVLRVHVLRVRLPDDVVEIAFQNIGLDWLLTTLRSLMERAGGPQTERVAHIRLRRPSDAEARGTQEERPLDLPEARPP